MTKEKLELANKLSTSIYEMYSAISDIDNKSHLGHPPLNIIFTDDKDLEEAKVALIKHFQGKIEKLEKEFDKL